MKTLLVMGGSKGVWEEASEAMRFFHFDAIACTNNTGVDYPLAFDFWCSLHPERLFPEWLPERKRRGYPDGFKTCTHEGWLCPDMNDLYSPDFKLDFRVPGTDNSGSSGMLAVRCGLAHGFDRIVLAGVPITPVAAHYFDNKEWHECESFKRAWVLAKESLFKGRVRSMSGFTRQLLGEPDSIWIPPKP